MQGDSHIATKEKILIAAQNIFIEKGKDGARMQEIADIAGVNKAMLFYYFTNKDLLYEEVLRSNLSQIFPKIKNIIISEVEPQQKIEQLVNAYISFFLDNENFLKLILKELSSGGENIRQILLEIKQRMLGKSPNLFVSMIDESITKNQFRNIHPKQTIISIMGLCLIYFIGKPILEILLDLENIDKNEFIEERKKSIIDLLKYGILVRNNNDE